MKWSLKRLIGLIPVIGNVCGAIFMIVFGVSVAHIGVESVGELPLVRVIVFVFGVLAAFHALYFLMCEYVLDWLVEAAARRQLRGEGPRPGDVIADVGARISRIERLLGGAIPEV